MPLLFLEAPRSFINVVGARLPHTAKDATGPADAEGPPGLGYAASTGRHTKLGPWRVLPEFVGATKHWNVVPTGILRPGT